MHKDKCRKSEQQTAGGPRHAAVPVILLRDKFDTQHGLASACRNTRARLTCTRMDNSITIYLFVTTIVNYCFIRLSLITCFWLFIVIDNFC